MMSFIARVPSNVSSSTSVSPGKRSYGNKSPWSTIAEKEERPGRPDIGIDRKRASDHYYHEQFMDSFPKQATQSGMMTVLGLLKSGKLILRCTSDRGEPDETSWRATRETQPGFSHEETHQDGTAQCVVNEVCLVKDRGDPDDDS